MTSQQDADNPDIEFSKEFAKVEDDLKSFKKGFKQRFWVYMIILQVLGNISSVYFLIVKNYWYAFITWFIFFPDIQEFKKMFKFLLKIPKAPKQEVTAHHD